MDFALAVEDIAGMVEPQLLQRIGSDRCLETIVQRACEPFHVRLHECMCGAQSFEGRFVGLLLAVGCGECRLEECHRAAGIATCRQFVATIEQRPEAVRPRRAAHAASALS